MIEVIVFDLGGVVVNVNLNTPLGVLFDNSGKLQNTFNGKTDFTGLLQNFETGKLSALNFHEKIVNHLGIELSFDEFISLSNDAIEAGDDGINTIIESLSRKYKLAILSNTNPVHFDYIKDNYSIIGLFDHTVLSYEMGTVKPDIKAFEKLMHATSKLPSQHLFIDDRIENIIAAKGIGMDGIQYKSIKSLIAALNERGISI